MAQYENIILFLSKSIPLASFYVSSGIDFRFENPWEIDTTLLELRNWYSSTLDTLCLHLWHHRDLLDYVIEYKILDEFPNLMPPYIEVTYKDGKIKLRGFLGAFWEILQERLNFSSVFISEEFRDGIFYSRNGLRDVILHPTVISSKDIENFDYTFSLFSNWYFLYIQNSDEGNSSSSYVRNLSAKVWAYIGLMLLMFILCLYIVLYIYHRFLYLNTIDDLLSTRQTTTADKSEESKKRKKEHLMRYKLRVIQEGSLGNCFMIVLGAFCSQGYILSCHTTAVRTLMLTLIIFGMIMSNSYSALLVSQLTLRERYLPFTKLDEIPHEASDYSLCVREASVPYTYFKVNETSTQLKDRWAKIVNQKPCVEGLIPEDVMCAPQTAFLETPAIMQRSISRNFKCKMTYLKEKYHKVQTAVLLQKDFDKSVQSEMNKEILKYRELGILEHLKKIYIRQDEFVSPAEDPVLQVTFEHVEGVLLTYACCVGVSFALLLIEIFIENISKYLLIQK